MKENSGTGLRLLLKVSSFFILNSSFHFKHTFRAIAVCGAGLPETNCPPGCIKRTARRLRRMVTSSPASSSATTWPSALKMVAGMRVVALTRMVEDSGKMMERFESACGQIGVSAKTSAVGKHHRAAGRQRIRRGTGRRTDDQPVAAVARDEFAVHAHVQPDEARNGAAADDNVVERGFTDGPALATPPASIKARDSNLNSPRQM
jgi:hypothetical protein